MTDLEVLKSAIGELRVRVEESLSKHTYFKIGGPAKYFFEAKSTEDLVTALKTAREHEIPFVVLGGGANVLVSDSGFDGLVIKNSTQGIKLVGIKGVIGKMGKGIKKALIWTASGTLMNQLARFSIDNGLSGVEFLLSVPGTVGGGIKINSHYEVEKGEFIGNKLASAALFNPQSGDVKNVDNKYFEFGYDSSKIQKTNEIVLEATFALDTAENPETLWQKAMDDVKRRNMEQPIGVACSGCVFRNISHNDAMKIASPNLTTSTGYVIESLGLKGQKIGGAQISEKHANYFLNVANATAGDVLKLINLVKEKAKNTYGIDLEEEIFLIGDFSSQNSN